MNKEFNLKDVCRNATNKGDDNFVGLRLKNELDQISPHIEVIFPLGYRISNEDELVREDILILFNTLKKYGDKEYLTPKSNLDRSDKSNSFPLDAYLVVINDFLNRGGYYQDKEEEYISHQSGKVNWNRTIRKETAYLTNNNLIYLKMQVHRNNFTDKNLITEISKYCVYESFIKIGWLYGFKLPQKPTFPFNREVFITTLRNQLIHTNKDNEKKLFQSMLDIIYLINKDLSENNTFYYGSNHFEHIWEKLIDNNFGISDKQPYLPRATWKLYFNNNKLSSALQPDTVMLKDGVYILDAKYYRYGDSCDSNDLPNSSSINKQITYGEFAANKSELHQGYNVYNAFLMPFNKESWQLKNDQNYLLIGTAELDSRKNNKSYELVYGVLIDTKHLMSMTLSYQEQARKNLANLIKNAYETLN